MRQILEQKSLEEIKRLEQKVLNINSDNEADLMEIFTTSDNHSKGRVILIDKTTDERIDSGINSPSEGGYNIMKQVLGDPLKCPIKEDANEQSIKETSLSTSKMNALTNVNSVGKANKFSCRNKSTASDREIHSDRTTLLK